MGYFVIIVFTTFLGSPPEFFPIAFKENNACEKYLINNVKNKYQQMLIKETKEKKYLTNVTNSKFIVCKKLEYPI